MYLRNIGAFLLNLLLFFVLQVLLFQNFSLGESAFCFIYVQVLLLAPLEISTMLLLPAAFLFGIGIDVFYDTMGMHAAASVFTAFARSTYLRLLEPTGGYEGLSPNMRDLGTGRFLALVGIGSFLHILILLSIEASKLSLLGSTLGKTFFSTLLTVTVIYLIQLLTGQNRKRKRSA